MCFITYIIHVYTVTVPVTLFNVADLISHIKQSYQYSYRIYNYKFRQKEYPVDIRTFMSGVGQFHKWVGQCSAHISRSVP